MHVTFTPKHQNKIRPARLPALIAAYSVVGFDPAAQRVVEVAVMRLYASPRAARIHACTWVHPAEGAPRHGYGAAGYCRRSAAGACALEAAGVELSKNIDGRGTAALRDALLATAAAARPDPIGLMVTDHE